MSIDGGEEESDEEEKSWEGCHGEETEKGFGKLEKLKSEGEGRMVCDSFGKDIYRDQGMCRPVKRGHVASEEGKAFCVLTRLFGFVEGLSSLIGETA